MPKITAKLAFASLAALVAISASAVAADLSAQNPLAAQPPVSGLDVTANKADETGKTLDVKENTSPDATEEDSLEFAKGHGGHRGHAGHHGHRSHGHHHAHHNHHRHHHFGHRRIDRDYIAYRSGPTYAAPSATGCEYYHEQWKLTGDDRWKQKYIACIS